MTSKELTLPKGSYVALQNGVHFTVLEGTPRVYGKKVAAGSRHTVWAPAWTPAIPLYGPCKVRFDSYGGYPVDENVVTSTERPLLQEHKEWRSVFKRVSKKPSQ